MKKFFSYIWNYHAEIYKGIVFVLSIAIVVYVFPKEGKFKYEFQNLKGKPWHHENLIAPFDFSILKTKEEISAEKDAILKNSKPYFSVDTSVYKNRLNLYTRDFYDKWNASMPVSLRERSYNAGKAMLDTLYSKGIIELNEVIENKAPDADIFILVDNIAEEHELRDVFTVQSAFNYINKYLVNRQDVDKIFLLPLLESAITQNIIYDPLTTKKVLDQALDNISHTRDVVLKEQSIITKGEIVDAEKYQVLESLKAEYEGQSGGKSMHLYIVFGQVIIIGVCFLILILFLALFRKDIFADNTKVTFIFLIIVLMVLMAATSQHFDKISIYLLPFCILPMVIRAFFDTRIALFSHVMATLIISFLAPNRFEFVFLELIAGIIAIFSIANMRNRSQVFISSGIIFLSYSLCYFGITVIQEGRADTINWNDIAWFGASATLSLFSYPLIFAFEKIFGFMSDVSLMELSDTNNPLLRELASKAPGTFQHSLQVANLAEEVIFKIGGNPLLVRTGALYHDVGKLDMPLYFIENQTTGINPHEELSSEESASIIIGHVIRGIEKAKKHNIPEQIIDFIRTHHGTTKTAYFYRILKNSLPEEEIDESKFLYRGPIPYSKETCALMIADSIEAASRSLKRYDAESIDELVERIIDEQISQKQFINANVTFKDITSIKKILKKKLMNIYHVRVEYPR